MNLRTAQADQTATRLARSASALMLLSAAISAYWAVGGTELLDTVGGSIARWGRDGGATVRLALAAIVVLKLVAAWLPARAVGVPCPRAVRRLAGLEAAILTVYGGVLTCTGLVVQAGFVGVGAAADWKALDWHVYLWDPWFLVVGLLISVALRRTRSAGPGAHGRRYGRGARLSDRGWPSATRRALRAKDHRAFRHHQTPAVCIPLPCEPVVTPGGASTGMATVDLAPSV
jgi:hypothetical protein